MPMTAHTCSRKLARPFVSLSVNRRAAKSKYSEARAEDALSAATCIHRSSTPSSNSLSSAVLAWGESVKPNVQSSWKRSLASWSSAMFTSFSTRSGWLVIWDSARRTAFSRTPASGSSSAVSSKFSCSFPRPSRVHKAWTRPNGERLSFEESNERLNGIWVVTLHQEALCRPAPPDVRVSQLLNQFRVGRLT